MLLLVGGRVLLDRLGPPLTRFRVRIAHMKF
jgi:hypothetical protein